jgi:hypothetical protein
LTMIVQVTELFFFAFSLLFLHTVWSLTWALFDTWQLRNSKEWFLIPLSRICSQMSIPHPARSFSWQRKQRVDGVCRGGRKTPFGVFFFKSEKRGKKKKNLLFSLDSSPNWVHRSGWRILPRCPSYKRRCFKNSIYLSVSEQSKNKESYQRQFFFSSISRSYK